MNQPTDNCVCPCCKTGHYVAHATRYIFCSDECKEAFYPNDAVEDAQAEAEVEADKCCIDTANVTFGDFGVSSGLGKYLTVVMNETTDAAFEEVHNRFFRLFGVMPQSRSKFCSGEVTFYSSNNGDRSPFA